MATGIFLLAGVVRLLLILNPQSPSAPTPEPSPLRKVRVTLLGPVSKVEGVDVPREATTERITFFQIEDPSVLTVTLPGGREMSLAAKTAFVNVNHRIVVDVDLLPLMESVPYKEAMTELRRCLKAMNITPNERMKREMAQWPEDSPGLSDGFFPATYRAGMWITESVGLSTKVRPAADGGWFLVLTLAAHADARRAPLDPGPRAATEGRTAEGPKDKDSNRPSQLEGRRDPE